MAGISASQNEIAPFTNDQILKVLPKIITRQNVSTISPKAIREGLEQELGFQPGSFSQYRDQIRAIAGNFVQKLTQAINDEEDEDNVPMVKTVIAPTQKKRKQADEDEEENDARADQKVSRTSNAPASHGVDDEKGQPKKGANGEVVIPLGKEFLRASVRKFNKITLVDIRKFYKDKGSGELKPGNKGISLTISDWKELKDNIGRIDEGIALIS